jgi:hypothetical protein
LGSYFQAPNWHFAPGRSIRRLASFLQAGGIPPTRKGAAARRQSVRNSSRLRCVPTKTRDLSR